MTIIELKKIVVRFFDHRYRKECDSMPSKKEYDLVSDDGYDNKIPLHNDEAFQHGIHFQAKYIGTLDVPRPSSRVEIVAAMRRIRYEFKAKGVKKKNVDLTVSIEGVKVSISKKKRVPQWYDESKLLIVHHPIYRIFYVSHDSQDLKIWSYIARDGPTNVFKCNVFKSYKKEQAMRIVRTIGQAFEVCHKLSVAQTIPSQPEHGETISDQTMEMAKNKGADEEDKSNKDHHVSPTHSPTLPPNELVLKQNQQQIYYSLPTQSKVASSALVSPGSDVQDGASSDQPISAQHQLQLLQQQVELEQQQTQVAVAQVHLLKGQLAAETAARIESQARTHQLLMQNRELLDHMKQIFSRLQSLELHNTHEHQKGKDHGMLMPNMTTPQSGPVFLPKSLLPHADLLESYNVKPLMDVDSPDSGHREMSSDSLSVTMQQSDFPMWAMSHDELPKYSFGFGSPVRYKQLSYEMTAVVNSNPFANSREDICDQDDNLDFSNVGAFPKECDVEECGVGVTPKIKPPPEFRNFGNVRNSQLSDDSSNSSNSDADSLKDDGIVNFTDSDYFSQNRCDFQMNNFDQSDSSNEAKQTLLRPTLEHHYDTYSDRKTIMQKYFGDVGVGMPKRHASFSDEENTESYDEVHVPSPPPVNTELLAEFED